MSRILALILLLVLGGCAEAPPIKPYYTEDVLVVPESNWETYWVRDESAVANILRKTGGPPNPGGCFRMRVIIDSNGRLFDGKMVGLVGDTAFYNWVMEFMAAQRFKPAYGNPRRIPIQTTMKWTFERLTAGSFPSVDIRWASDNTGIAGVEGFEANCEAIMDKEKI